MDSSVLFFLIQGLGSIFLLFSNNCCPTVFILGSKIGVDRTDSLGTVPWYFGYCPDGTVALDDVTVAQ